MGDPKKCKKYSVEEALNFILDGNALAAHNLGESLDGNQVTPATDLSSQSSLVYTNLDEIVDVVNEESTVAANSLEESLDRDQSDVNISSESNLFQLADVDEMCSEALSLVKDVGDLLSFQNANISPNPDKMMAHKSTGNRSFSDSDSEGSQKKVSSDEESGWSQDQDVHFQKENDDKDYMPSDNVSSDDDDLTNHHRSGKRTKKAQPETSKKCRTDLESIRDDFDVANLQNAAVAKVGSKSSKRRSSVALKNPLLPPCQCKKMCGEKMDEEARKVIHRNFWEIARDEQRSWIFGQITRKPKQTSRNVNLKQKDRQHTFEYRFNVNDVEVQVCKVFFLRTLGYKYDTVITNTFRDMSPNKIRPPYDKRGKHKPKHALTEEDLNQIDEHIESFGPSISHYRRSHAPLRRYLPPELTLIQMHRYYREKYPDATHSIESYRRRLKLKNISFCKLGEEECEVCIEHSHHRCRKNDEGEATGIEDSDCPGISIANKKIDAAQANMDRTEEEKESEQCNSATGSLEEKLMNIVSGICDICDNWVSHIKMAKESRDAYRKDADAYNDPNDGTCYMSADMQKVIMLPRLPGVKTVVFTRRIVAYHETFAPLVPSKEVKKQWKEKNRNIPRPFKPLGIVWHEGVQGRNDEDVASTVRKCIYDQQYRCANEVIIWADNCTGQLKNWTFYSSLVYEVNNHPSISTIRIKYFEKGHTFMSADSFHAGVENVMREKKKLYDFEDLKRCIERHGFAIEMKEGDFIDYRNELSQAKDTEYPLLADVVEAKFTKGTSKMFWKLAHSSDSYQNGEFLQKKFRDVVAKCGPLPKKRDHGVNKVKLDQILLKIGPLIPRNYLNFWEELPSNETSKDLTTSYDHLDRAEESSRGAMNSNVQHVQGKGVSLRKKRTVILKCFSFMFYVYSGGRYAHKPQKTQVFSENLGFLSENLGSLSSERKPRLSEENPGFLSE